MMPRRHVVISGTGRAGTSFLVELLTNLGLDTGFRPDNLEQYKNKLARAGLERDLREPSAPYIIKSPLFRMHADEVLGRDDITIDHVFIPMRDLAAAAESSRFVTAQTLATMPLLKRIRRRFFPKSVVGGVWDTNNASSQEKVLLSQVYDLLLSLSRTTIPVTLLQYPLLVNDAPYLYGKLQPVLGDITLGEFDSAFNRTVKKDLVHCFTANDRAA